MSANEMDDEFGVAEDLEDLLAVPKPAKKSTYARGGMVEPAKPEAAAGEQAGRPVSLASSPEPLTAEQVRAMFAEMKTGLRTEIEADLKAQGEKSPKSRDNRPIDIQPSEPPEEGTAADGIRVHFVEDGFTILGRVFYRGEEFIAPSDSEWARLTPAQQIARYGRQLFRQGPWEGADFDLNDPALTEDDRAKLLEIMQKRQAAGV